MTEEGKQLARVCLIEYASGIVIYDQLVKPGKPVVDYLTRYASFHVVVGSPHTDSNCRWSGITAEGLSKATATFEEVQAHILSVLSATPTPVLLGHSLESDLNSLKICHPRCIDTAVIFHHPRGRPLKPGLAWLTKKWCGREIQNRGEGGHDPEEDARACVDLLRKKVDNGELSLPATSVRVLTIAARSGIRRVQGRHGVHLRAHVAGARRHGEERGRRPWEPRSVARAEGDDMRCVQERRRRAQRSRRLDRVAPVPLRTLYRARRCARM